MFAGKSSEEERKTLESEPQVNSVKRTCGRAKVPSKGDRSVSLQPPTHHTHGWGMGFVGVQMSVPQPIPQINPWQNPCQSLERQHLILCTLQKTHADSSSSAPHAVGQIGNFARGMQTDFWLLDSGYTNTGRPKCDVIHAARRVITKAPTRAWRMDFMEGEEKCSQMATLSRMGKLVFQCLPSSSIGLKQRLWEVTLSVRGHSSPPS